MFKKIKDVITFLSYIWFVVIASKMIKDVIGTIREHFFKHKTA